jgi:putative membrane protein
MRTPMRATVFGVVGAVLSLSHAVVHAQAITDAQIAAIVVTANQVDIDAGKLAEASGTDPEIKAFGKQMAAAHAGVNKQAGDLVAKLGVTPEDNDTARSLKAGGADNVKRLSGLKGAAFDRAYIDREIAYHQQVLDALDKTLIPGAKNSELKALLVKVRPAFVAHLEHAKSVAKTLKH